jgi:hypothetical protein
MNKRQHKKNFINKVYGLSLNNDYVIIEFDPYKIRPEDLYEWVRLITTRIHNKLVVVPNCLHLKQNNDENVKLLKAYRDMLDKEIEKLEA